MRLFSELTPCQTQWAWLSLIIAITAIVIAVDVVTVCTFGVEHSLSWLCRRVFTRYISVLLALCVWFGILLGHCFPPE